MKIVLEDINKLRPDEDNPRTPDERRLLLIENSINTLGFIFPIYATPDGLILSGHQRVTVAKRMGISKVPVFYLNIRADKIKGINIIFNRATNDAFVKNSTTVLSKEIEKNFQFLTKKRKKTKELYPCINQVVKRSVKDLATKNIEYFESKNRNMAMSLYRKTKVVMPILIDSNDKIINGIGRVEVLAENGIESADCIVIPESNVEYAVKAVNLISMNFDFDSYKDTLRSGSFRRASGRRKEIGNCYIVGLGKKTYKKNLSLLRKQWIDYYGKTILDFGAGHVTDNHFLKENGIEVDFTYFEPYPVPKDEYFPSVEIARNYADAFFKRIINTKFDSIILQSVLNSVPFEADRKKVCAIINNLCTKRTKVHFWMEGYKRFKSQIQDALDDTRRNSTHFCLDYEPRITIAEIIDCPKVQKFHTPKELYDLLKEFWEIVKIKEYGSCLYAVAQIPKKIPFKQLEEALKFEFELPYKDGSKIGRSKEAIEAFKKRINNFKIV